MAYLGIYSMEGRSNAQILHPGILLKCKKCRNLNQDDQCIGANKSTSRQENVAGVQSIL
jgi:hypothetical protein